MLREVDEELWVKGKASLPDLRSNHEEGLEVQLGEEPGKLARAPPQ